MENENPIVDPVIDPLTDSPEMIAQKAAETERIAVEEQKKLEEVKAKPVDQLTDEEKALIAKHEVVEDEENEDKPFEKIAKITGYTVEGEFELSHEGIAKYALKYKELGNQEWENSFKENYPEAYALAEHLDKNGKLEDFFKSDRVDYTKITLDEKNQDQLTSMIDADLKSKGISDSRRKVMIKAAIDTGTLVAEAKESFKNLQDSQKGQIEREELEYQQKEAKKAVDIQKFVGGIDKTVMGGDIGGFIIPEAEKKAFAEHYKSTLRYEDGKFLKIIEITPENMNIEMQKEFLGFKKGNLQDIVQRQAKTINALKLKTKVVGTENKKGAVEVRKPGNMSLKDLI